MLTRQGWVVAAVAVVAIAVGRLLGSLELFVLGVVATALVLCAVLYATLRRVRVEVRREIHPARVHAGTPSRVDVRVENTNKRRSPVLGLRDAVSGTRGASLSVGPLPSHGVAHAAYRLPTERRGILTVGPLEVAFSDPFGLTSLSLRAAGTAELTVYPHVDEIPPVPQTTGNDPLAGADHPNALGRGGEDFYALRNYVVGDDLRRVHWPSTARHDDLMVRQGELPWQGRCTILADVRFDVHTADSLEHAISAAASLVTASGRRQDLVRLVVTDSSDSGASSGHAHTEGIMEHLAGLEGSDGALFRRVVERLARSSGGGALVAITTDATTDADLQLLLGLRSRFGSVRVVQLDRAGGPSSAPEQPPASRARGTVLRVPAGTGFAEAWIRHVDPHRSTRRWRAPVQPGTDDDRQAVHERLHP